MIKNVPVNKFLRIDIEKYCLYNKHRKPRIHMSLVVL